MPKFALVGSSVDASGHPGACGSVASGSVEEDNATSLSVDGRPIGNGQTCTIEIPSHGHSTDDEGNCTGYQSHDFAPTETVADTITLDGEPLYLATDSVDTDPTSGGPIDITDANGNSTVSL